MVKTAGISDAFKAYCGPGFVFEGPPAKELEFVEQVRDVRLFGFGFVMIGHRLVLA